MAVLGQILARSLLESDSGTLAACRPAFKSAFWDHWELGRLGQILARSFLDSWRRLVTDVRLLYQAEGRSNTERGKPKGKRIPQMTWDQGRVG